MFGTWVMKLFAMAMIVVGFGFGAFFGFQSGVVQDMQTSQKELLSLAIFVFGTGVAWATVKADIKIVRKELEDGRELLRTQMFEKFKQVKLQQEHLSGRIDRIEHPRHGNR